MQSEPTEAFDQPLSAGTQGLSRALQRKVRQLVADGVLRDGARLPSSRRMAKGLRVSRGTVVQALESLVAEGLLEARIGSGTFVAQAASQSLSLSPPDHRSFANAIPAFDQPDVDVPAISGLDLRPCRPSMASFPLMQWRRSISLASNNIPSSDYAHAQGDLGLREQLSEYLRRSRGMSFSPDELLITNGALHAMYLAASLFLRPGDKVIVEDPGYPLARQLFASRGARLLPCPVDKDGLCIDNLPPIVKDVRFAYVTPSHQFPRGSRLSLSRRRALIEWAEANDAIILEDDYDGEFRYDVPPLPPMASMKNSSVLYCGTFSKTLFPGLRLGFAAGPADIMQAMAKQRVFCDYAGNSLNQSALSHFIANGHYERHLHRMRRLYSKKREALKVAVDEYGKGARVVGLDSGLNANLLLPDGVSGNAVSAQALDSGILVPALRRYAMTEKVADDAIVVGYAAASESQLAAGIQQIFS